MVSVGLSICLVLQTPSHLAGPLVMPGSMPGMQGMVQWTIRRKFPAVDWTGSPETTGSWTITGEKWKGWRQRVGWKGMEQDAWTNMGLGLTLRQQTQWQRLSLEAKSDDEDGMVTHEEKRKGWVGMGWFEEDGWKGHGEKSKWAVIELQRRKTNNHPSKGRWARAVDNCGTGRGQRDRGMSLEMRFPLISPWLGDSEWEEKDTHTHLRGRFLARESLDLTDSPSLWLSDPALVLSPTLCHLQRLSSSVWTAKTTLPNPDPD